MLGEKELLKLFPEYSDTIQPSGIDLRMDKIYIDKSVLVH